MITPRSRSRRYALTATMLALIPVATLGASVDARTTSTIPPRVDTLVDGRATGESFARLKEGLDALSSGNVAVARSLRDILGEHSLDRDILAWAIALKGGRQVSSSEIAEAAKALPGWPGLAAFRRNSEQALLREQPEPKAVIRAFGDTPPQTAAGVIILARSHVAIGDLPGARAVLSPFWRAQKLNAGDEAAIVREFGAIIPVADHRHRMERMLYAERVNSAARIAKHADAEALFAAWKASINGDRAAAKLLDAVPADQRGAGYLFAKSRMLRRADKIEDAAAIMLTAPKDRATLIDPDAWWIERRVLSREFVDKGDMKTAYAIVAAHAAESPVNQVDAEFHAGWYAFRHLGDAQLGAEHFARIPMVAEGAISLSRAFYWLGRTAEAGGPGDAKAYFARAASYGTTFYGQLAAERIGNQAINVAYPAPTAADRVAFSKRDAVAAIRRLETAGYPALADTLYRDLAAQLTSPGEIALLAAMAEARGNHYLALRIGKAAAARGIDVGALSHPTGVIPPSANISGSGEALAYAIARQESEFNIGAVSGAGARGLLQLLPGTAKEVAKRAGLAYSQQRLTTDAGYNAALGSAFLGEQLGRFDGSYVLTFAGYNAGPRRAQQWVARYGDPRGKDIDEVVDWIERIPYAETRSYVQRVMENYQVYKMRLTGKFNITEDLVDGR